MRNLKNILQEILEEKIISEASKVDVLINKLGLNQTSAEKIYKKCGPLSVWMTNKLKELVKLNLENWGREISNESINEYLNQSLERNQFDTSITSIMDFIRVGLNGNISNIKNLNYNDLYKKSVDWHESLEIGGGDINYEEKNPIIKDFRDDNGFGFYWVDLETNNSDEECKRMGHCGRTGYGNTLISLRETKKIPNTKYTINKSHLTAALGEDGRIYQLKGPKNSKPKEQYYEYILPLFYVLGGGGEEEDYLIKGFGSEYASDRDFKLSDLPDSVIKDLYQNRPELFTSRSMKKKLESLGIIELPPIEMIFNLEMKPNQVGNYIDGDYTVRTTRRKTETGYEKVTKYGLFETILSGDMWDLWNYYDADWKGALEYSVNDENAKKIEELLREMAKEGDVEFDEDLSLEDKIEEYDGNYEIQSAINSSVNDAESDAYGNDIYDALKEALEEYGVILKMDDTGVVVRIDLSNHIQNINDEYLDELFEGCSDSPGCVFEELMYQGDIDKPMFNFNSDYYSPDMDDNYFNDILADRLGEI